MSFKASSPLIPFGMVASSRTAEKGRPYAFARTYSFQPSTPSTAAEHSYLRVWSIELTTLRIISSSSMTRMSFDSLRARKTAWVRISSTSRGLFDRSSAFREKASNPRRRSANPNESQQGSEEARWVYRRCRVELTEPATAERNHPVLFLSYGSESLIHRIAEGRFDAESARWIAAVYTSKTKEVLGCFFGVLTMKLLFTRR